MPFCLLPYLPIEQTPGPGKKFSRALAAPPPAPPFPVPSIAPLVLRLSPPIFTPVQIESHSSPPRTIGPPPLLTMPPPVDATTTSIERLPPLPACQHFGCRVRSPKVGPARLKSLPPGSLQSAFCRPASSVPLPYGDHGAHHHKILLLELSVCSPCTISRAGECKTLCQCFGSYATSSKCLRLREGISTDATAF